MVPDMICPTPEQCENNARMPCNNGQAFACWYPQMGGYVSRCVVIIQGPTNKFTSCFDAYIWHDGNFPFIGKKPIRLHHCDPQQFIDFGEWVKGLGKL